MAVLTRRRPFALLLATACCLVSTSLAAQKAGSPTEFEVKAAFVYNFGLFVEWPAGARAQGPFAIGVLGKDDLTEILVRDLAGKRLGQRPLEVRRMARVEDATDVSILLIARSEERRLPAILTSLDGRAVLTVSDLDGFAERGGMIGFRVEKKRVRFDVNPDKAARSGLAVSSQLLKLARVVTSPEAR